MGETMWKNRLSRYVHLEIEYYDKLDSLARLTIDTEFPAFQAGDGSQRSLLKSSRMEKAAIRKMARENKLRAQIAEIETEMEAIEDAIESLADPLQKTVLRLRYIEGEANEFGVVCRLMRWGEVSQRIYGSDDEKHKLAIWRIHGHALTALGEKEETRKDDGNDSIEEMEQTKEKL